MRFHKLEYSWKYELLIRYSETSNKNTVVKKVRKGVWRMPRLTEAMKDVISCDKLRVGANNLWSGDFRMGQPSRLKDGYSYQCKRANAGNWNILVPVGRENKLMIPLVVASERGRAQTMIVATQPWGCRTTLWHDACERNVLERTTIEGDSPVLEARWSLVVSWVTRNTRNSARIRRDHPVRLNTPVRPIANQYCEGKVKRTPSRGVK